VSQEGLEPQFLADVTKLLTESPFDWYVTEAVRPMERSALLYDEYVNGIILRDDDHKLCCQNGYSDDVWHADHVYHRLFVCRAGRWVPKKGPRAAPAGKSAHNYGLAIDVALDGAPQPGLQMCWSTAHAGWRWLKAATVPHPRLKNGWSFGDWPHVEKYRWTRYKDWQA
jgi:hypothetical protein